MRKNSILMAAVLAAVTGFTFMTSKADAANIAANPSATVSAYGTVNGDLTTVIDEIFLQRSTQWQTGTVWWSQNVNDPQYVQVNLNGLYNITQFVVQVDDNDAYTLQYQNQAGDWLSAWEIPVVGGWGMQTRPNPLDDSERYTLASPITAQALRLFHTEGTGGDGYYSVSEIQAYGDPVNHDAPVPEPASALLGLMGVTGLLGARKNKKASA